MARTIIKWTDGTQGSPLRSHLRRLRSPSFWLMLACVPSAALSEVRLGPEALGGNYSVPVKTWWDIPFRAIVRQRYDFSCGSAAVATLLTHHYGLETPEQAPFAAMWKAGNKPMIKKSGFSMFDMKNYLDSIGFQAQGYRMDIAALRKSNRPSIVLLDLKGFKHFVVVKGFRDNVIVLGDPIRGLTKYDVRDFAKMWNGIALAINKTPANRKPGYNLAIDWNPWSTAPIDANVQVANIGDITTHLPPLYQLTPQLLLDVRVGTVR